MMAGDKMESSKIIKAALILGAAIIIATLLHGGIYEINDSGVAATYKLNKFTGAVTYEYPGKYLAKPKGPSLWEQYQRSQRNVIVP